jgi:ABC-2 type transport system permease protein
VLEGHGEAPDERLADITRELQTFYSVKRVRIDGRLGSLDDYDAIVVAAPDSDFSEKDKFVLDQFIMKGGRALWLIDGMQVTMDSLQFSDETIALANDINLSDMLFRYGVRINNDLVLDLQAAPIPVVTGRIGNRPSQSLLPWYYFPVVVPRSKHPIVNNLNAVKFDFVSSIDAVGSSQVVKTPLLSTSMYSRIFLAPARVSLEIMRDEPDERLFSSPPKTVAMLLEGTFTSNFKNRIPPQIAGDSTIGFRAESAVNRMIVVSDGDVIQNGFRKSNSGIIPLGLDRYTGQLYGNKSFIMNCIDYLCDDSGLITLRSKEFKLRLLDKTRLAEELTWWKVVNTAGPVLLIVLFGIVKTWRRKRKYSSRSS